MSWCNLLCLLWVAHRYCCTSLLQELGAVDCWPKSQRCMRWYHCKLFNFAIGLFIPPAFINITYRTCIIFGVLCFGAAVQAYLTYPETCGKTLSRKFRSSSAKAVLSHVRQRLVTPLSMQRLWPCLRERPMAKLGMCIGLVSPLTFIVRRA
jgi:hypothetical protein